MPALTIPSKLNIFTFPTGPTQQRAASKLTADDESNVLNIIFGISATVIALLSFMIGYRQLVHARRSSDVDNPPVELDGTSLYAYHPVAADEGSAQMGPVPLSATGIPIQETSASYSQER